MQAMRVNAAVAAAGDASTFLSPRQQSLATRVQAALKKNPKALGELVRPDRIEALPAYELALGQALAESGLSSRR